MNNDKSYRANFQIKILSREVTAEATQCENEGQKNFQSTEYKVFTWV